MGNEERRKYPRIQIFDPISYLSLDSDGGMLQQNVAVVRNVSQTGIQIIILLTILNFYMMVEELVVLDFLVTMMMFFMSLIFGL